METQVAEATAALVLRDGVIMLGVAMAYQRRVPMLLPWPRPRTEGRAARRMA